MRRLLLPPKKMIGGLDIGLDIDAYSTDASFALYCTAYSFTVMHDYGKLGTRIQFKPAHVGCWLGNVTSAGTQLATQ